jgi:Carbohydrate family 9 binding domain-like
MKYIYFKRIVLSQILLLLLISSHSQTKDSTIVKRTYQTAFAKTIPVIDGRMNDDCWNLVDWSGKFTQSQPVENKPPSQETAFKVLYDNDNLYIFIRAYDTEPNKISRIMSRRDNFSGDMVYVDIDSYFDKQTDFLFAVSERKMHRYGDLK